MQHLRVTFTSKTTKATHLCAYGTTVDGTDRSMVEAIAICVQQIEDNIPTSQLTDEFDLHVELLGEIK